MSFLNIKNVSIKGLSACVPETIEYVSDIYKGVEQFTTLTGIKARRIANADTCTSDLCLSAAEKLIAELGWEKCSLDALIFVTQTPDYLLPATSCILQDRLGLSKDCYTLDLSLGCSGWVYGLSVIVALMHTGTIKRGLLLTGETTSKSSGHNDKSTYPLFGDAGTATALEFDAYASGMQFVFNTDGSGADAIIIRDGGYRNPTTADSLVERDCGNGIVRNRLNVELEGIDVFSFGISKAPKSIKQLCDHFGINMETVDMFTFHQANMMMNEMIRKKLKLPKEKVPYCIEEYGNTSSASIPLALVTRCSQALQKSNLRHVACGFGVGLSWGSVYFETDKIKVPKLVEI